MVDWTGLAAFAGAAPQGYDEAQQRQNALRIQQQQIQDTDQKKQALALLLSGISQGGGQAGGQPQSSGVGPQMQPSQPGPGPQPMGPPQAPGAGPMPPMRPQVQPGPSPRPQQPQQQTVIPTPQAPNFEGQLRAMAQRIKAANPNADPAAIGEAVMNYAKLVQTDDSRQTRLIAQQMQLQNRFDIVAQQLSGRMDVVQAQQQGANQRNQNTVQGAMDRTQFMGDVREKLAAGQGLSPDDIDRLATVRANGDPGVMALGLSKGDRGKILALATEKAQENGTTLDKVDLDYRSKQAGASVAGRTGGMVAIGAAEIKYLGPIVTDLAAKVNTSQIPTVNALRNAVSKGTGDPNIVSLNSYIQTLQNAYQQVAARGGRISDQVRRYGEAMVNGNMPVSQIGAAVAAMTKEADIVKAATGDAMQSIEGGQPKPAAGNGTAIPSPSPQNAGGQAQEGSYAKNPQTGAWVQLKGGQWVPSQPPSGQQ